MKKNKTLAYALAATLLVGGTFVGTKALFTDKIDEIGGLKISTGDVDIEGTNTPKWSIARNGGNDSDENWGTKYGITIEKGLATFDNLKYGDIITKTVDIENKGTLNAIVSLDEKDGILSEDGHLLNNDGSSTQGIKFETTFTHTSGDTTTDIGKDKNHEFAPGDKGQVTFKIYVDGKGKHNEVNINSNTQEQKIIDLAEAYILNAEQLGSDNVDFTR